MLTIRAERAGWFRDEAGEWVKFLVRSFSPASLDEFRDKILDVSVREHREKRSLDANAYAWVLIDRISEKTRIRKQEIYREAVRDIGGNSDTLCIQTKAVETFRKSWERNGLGWMTDTLESKIPGCTNVIVYYGSSAYDTAQMSRLIDHLVQDAQTLGIETLKPEEQERMCLAWK